MADKISFFRSYHEASKDLDPETYKEAMISILDYAFDDKEIDVSKMSASARMFFMLTKPNIDASIKKSRGGAKGGRSQKDDDKLACENDKASLQESDKLACEKSEASLQKSVSDKDIGIGDRNKDKELGIGDRNKELGDRNNESKNKSGKATHASRHSYGEYNHVLLTDDQYNRFLDDVGEEVAAEAIKILDEYCQISGRKYKDYNLALRKWPLDEARRNGSRSSPEKSSPKPDKTSFMLNFIAEEEAKERSGT